MSLTLAGSDYEEARETLTFGPSFPTRQCANVAILQNTILEGEESFSVQLTAVGSDTVILAPATATVFITDQDRKLMDNRNYIRFYYWNFIIATAVIVSFEQSSYSVLEGSSVTVCGDLSSIAETTVTVTLIVTDGTAQQNSDFTLSLVMLIFQPDVTQSCTLIGAIDDIALEGDESFTLELQSTNNFVQISQTAGLTTVTIPNEDSKSSVFIIDSPSSNFLLFDLILVAMASFQLPSYSTTEGNSVQVCAALFPEADIQVSVSFVISGGAAQLATDFTLSPPTQVLTFEAGSVLSCVTVTAISDSLLEEDEDFTLTLQSSNTFVGISSIIGSSVVTIPNQNSKIILLLDIL